MEKENNNGDDNNLTLHLLSTTDFALPRENSDPEPQCEEAEQRRES